MSKHTLTALTLLAGTAAALAFPGPGQFATPPAHLGIDFRSVVFSSVNDRLYLAKADGFTFDSTGEFAWSRKFGIGVDSSPTDPREPRTEVFDFIAGQSLRNTVVTGMWLDNMTGPVAVSGAVGIGGATPDRAGDAFLPLNNNFGGVINGVDGATFDIAGFTTERVKEPPQNPQKVPESGNLLMVFGAAVAGLCLFKRSPRLS